MTGMLPPLRGLQELEMVPSEGMFCTHCAAYQLHRCQHHLCVNCIVLCSRVIGLGCGLVFW